ncbi:MAG: rhomboid family intramembrane serine protease [Mycobacteriales bacterium]
MRQASVGFQCPDCVKQGNKSMRPTKAAYGGRARSAPYVTYALIAINVVMLLATASGAGLLQGDTSNALFRKLALIPHGYRFVDGDGALVVQHGVADGQYYRLLTSTFLHFGVIHLALNMYGLYLLGPVLEQAFGQVRFAVTYLLSGLGGAALSYALGPQYEIAAGASGAVFGLFGAFYILGRRRNLDVSAITTTIALNLVLSFSLSGIDWRGHVGGLIAGAGLAWVIVYAPDTKQRSAYQAAGVGVVALVIFGMVVARTAQLT